jgi:hypothetical protein
MATAPNLSDESPRGLKLATVIETVRRRRLLALLPLLLVLAATVSLAFFLPSVWTARATVLVNNQLIPEAYVRSSVNVDPETRLLTLTHQILDGPRLSKIIEQYKLYPALRRNRPAADVVERMRRDIRVEIPEERERRNREGRMPIFTLAYTATDQEVAANVANTLAALFDEENRRSSQQQAAGTSEFLETQLREMRTRLAAQEQKITAYKEQNLGELPEQREVNLRTIERLQLQLSIAGENNRRAIDRRQLISQSLNDLDTASAMSVGGGAAPGGDMSAARPAGRPAPGADRAADDVQRQVPRRDRDQGADPPAGGAGRTGREEAGRGAGRRRRRTQERRRPGQSREPGSPAGRRQPLRAQPDAAAGSGRRRGQGHRRGDCRPQPPAGGVPAPAGEHAQARG